MRSSHDKSSLACEVADSFGREITAHPTCQTNIQDKI